MTSPEVKVNFPDIPNGPWLRVVRSGWPRLKAGASTWRGRGGDGGVGRGLDAFVARRNSERTTRKPEATGLRGRLRHLAGVPLAASLSGQIGHSDAYYEDLFQCPVP